MNDTDLPRPPLLQATPCKPWAQFWLTCLGLTLVWDASGADGWVMQSLGTAQGFALREHWLLSDILHDKARQVAQVLYVLLWAMVWWPLGVFKDLSRSQRLQSVLGVSWALLAVNLFKRSSLTSCPWELEAFGGVATYVSHWSWGVRDGGSGFCFPGGHASSALAFLAIALPWLTSPEARERRRGWRMTWAILALGLLLGGVQTLRGAHYPSHTAWTALLCAAVAWGHAGIWRGIKKPRNQQ